VRARVSGVTSTAVCVCVCGKRASDRLQQIPMTQGVSVVGERVAMEPPATEAELRLLPELLAVLKGAPSEVLRHEGETSFFQVANLSHAIDDSVVHLVRSVAEAGWLYAHRIRPFVQPHPLPGSMKERWRVCKDSTPAQESRTRAALRSALVAELQPYHLTLDQAERMLLQNRLCLQQLAMLIEPHRCTLLRWLAMIAEAAAEAANTANDAVSILNLVGRLQNHGDPAVIHTMGRIFSEVVQPLQRMVISWVAYGDLKDAGFEFFIQLDDRKFPALHPECVPYWIPKPLVERLFHAGLSRFLWDKWAQCATFQNDAVLLDSQYSPPATLARTSSFLAWLGSLCASDGPGSGVPVRSLFLDQYHLVHHLSIHRHFVLLEDGDFALHLTEKLEPVMLRATASVERSALLQALVEALTHTGLHRAGRAATEHLLDRLDVYLARPQTRDQDCIANAFTLTYLFPDPIDYLIRQCPHFGEYKRLYGVFWKLRLTQYQLAVAAHEHSRLYQDLKRWAAPGRRMPAPAAHDRAGSAAIRTPLANCALFRAHLHQCLQAVIQCFYRDVVDPAWRTCVANLHGEHAQGASWCTLIEALDAYFAQVVHELTPADQNTTDKKRSKVLAPVNHLESPANNATERAGARPSPGKPQQAVSAAAVPHCCRPAPCGLESSTATTTPAIASLCVMIRQFLALNQGICLRLNGYVRSLGYADPTRPNDDLACLDAALRRQFRQWQRVTCPKWRAALDASPSEALRRLAADVPCPPGPLCALGRTPETP